MNYFNTILANISQVSETGAIVMAVMLVLSTAGLAMCIDSGDENPFIPLLKYCGVTLLVLVLIYVLTNDVQV